MEQGHLIIGGGAIKASEKLIFSRFMDYAGGLEAKISVITVSSGYPAESYEAVAGILMTLGMAKENIRRVPLTYVSNLLDQGWSNVADASLLPYFEDTNGVWFTGGDQWKVIKSLRKENGEDTAVLLKIREILAGGGVVGGTSAGAAIMSRHMIVRGSDEGALNYPVCTNDISYSEEFEEQERMLLADGLGFFPEGIIDQHFNKRPRLQRLMSALSYYQEAIGYGISEDTALCYSFADKRIQILGSSYVMRVENKGAGSFATSLLYP